ncbi:hypothetical protein [Streptomyces sasae]|uniref:hypothetical protein n=1 Tax=Streptomyces sasae TaxID=1266772 RepID=UPI00292E16FA|nr:hypothetical protein [Streptomyces sasae]
MIHDFQNQDDACNPDARPQPCGACVRPSVHVPAAAKQLFLIQRWLTRSRALHHRGLTIHRGIKRGYVYLGTVTAATLLIWLRS